MFTEYHPYLNGKLNNRWFCFQRHLTHVYRQTMQQRWRSIRGSHLASHHLNSGFNWLDPIPQPHWLWDGQISLQALSNIGFKYWCFDGAMVSIFGIARSWGHVPFGSFTLLSAQGYVQYNQCNTNWWCAMANYLTLVWWFHSQQPPPTWMKAEHTVWFRDPCLLFKMMLENPDFQNSFDYAPF